MCIHVVCLNRLNDTFLFTSVSVESTGHSSIETVVGMSGVGLVRDDEHVLSGALSVSNNDWSLVLDSLKGRKCNLLQVVVIILLLQLLLELGLNLVCNFLGVVLQG